MIFWDEFTGALEMINTQQILLEVQNIAEAKDKGISLFIVSHKTRSSEKSNSEIVKKVMDRFEPITYSMDPITTYELMANSLKKEKEWEEIKDRFVERINPIVEKITESKEPTVSKALIDLYPIHPYTSYLASFIAQEIGSTERSIFKFLHEDTAFGFKNFIDTIHIDERNFLTAEYLWDFFFDDFQQSDDEKIKSAIQKYSLNKSLIEKEGDEYIAVFKVILLLNILYKIAEVSENSPIIPSRDNIVNVFVGSVYEKKVHKVLNDISEKEIINETPNNLFEVTTNSLPAHEIIKAKDEIEKNIVLKDIIDKAEFTKLNNRINRESKIEIYDSDIGGNKLKSKLEKDKTKPGSLKILLFLSKNSEDLEKIKTDIKEISKTELLKDKIILIPNIPFDNLDKYIDYAASAKVSERHSYEEDAKRNKEYARKYVTKWIKDIKSYYVTYYLNRNEKTIPFSKFADETNNKLSKEIFSKGLENISELNKTYTLWKKSHAKKAAENYVASTTFDELTSNNTGQHAKSIEILKDENGEYIVNSNLELIDTTPDNHPIKIFKDFVDEKFKKCQKEGTFNLGIELRPLTEAPYGLYPNIINMASLSFVLREYIDKLYDFNGQPIDKIKMKEKIIKLFEYWDKGKNQQDLEIRFGSEYEKKLVELFDNLFDLELESNNQSIKNIKWKIREWLKTKKTPLWMFKYSNNMNEKLKNAINSLIKFLAPEEQNIPDSLIKTCYEDLESVKIDLKNILKTDTNTLYKNFINDDTINIQEFKQYLKEQLPEEIYDWNETNVKNILIKYKDEKRIKKELAELLDNLFDLELESNDQSIENIKWKIHEWLKNKETPLWMFKYSNNHDAKVEIGINNLINFLESQNIPDSLIKTCYEDLESVKIDLKNILKTDTNTLYKNFINDDTINIQEFKQYIMKKSPREICDLDEAYMLRELMNFKEGRMPPELPTTNTGNIHLNRTELITKIKTIDETKLRDVIINIVENEEIIPIFSKYLEEE